jgi:hypothetical protein
MKKLMIFILLFVIISCETNDFFNGIVYVNSFENTSQLAHIEGGVFLSSDTPIDGGDSSMVISGGCIIPHVTFEIGPFDQDLDLYFRCWAKRYNDGSIRMYLVDNENEQVYLSVNDTVWTEYQIDVPLHCPAHNKVKFEMNSGGFVMGCMWVDLFQVFTK